MRTFVCGYGLDVKRDAAILHWAAQNALIKIGR
jgi:hypothetical protein